MPKIDHKQISTLVGVVSAFGVLITVILYFENKEYRSLQKQIADIDLEIKKIDLAHKKKTIAKT